MLISITNLTGQRVSVDSLRATISPFSTRTVKELGLKDLDSKVEGELKALAAANHISYSIKEDPNVDDQFEKAVLGMLGNMYHVDMLDAPDTTGTTAQVGFKLLSAGYGNIVGQKLVEISVYDDPEITALSSVATLNTAAKGTIVAGAGTAALKVLTNENGEFECTLTNLTPGSVYVTCSAAAGGPALDCTEIDAVVFS